MSNWKNIKTVFIQNFYLATLIVLLSCCKKNKLKGDYESFVGKYEWSRTAVTTGTGLSTTSSTFYSNEVNYTISFEFNEDGEALFYKNGSLVSKNKYKIQSKEVNAYGGKDLQIKLKGKLNGLNINEDKLTFNLSGDTALTIDKFPFPAIEEVSKYKPGYRSTSNKFIKN